MPAKTGRSWKMERASITTKGKKRPRSNKFRNGDGLQPAAGSRARIWVGAHTRGSVQVKGHYRNLGR